MSLIITQNQKNRVIDTINDLKNIVLEFEKLDLSVDEDEPLSEQVKKTENIIQSISLISENINAKYNDFSSLVGYELLPVLNNDLNELREKYLVEETDTPREAAENIAKFLESPGDTALLRSALKYLMTQVPPTVEETESIPFETAKIYDSNLTVDTEYVEIEGVDGEVKITYELIKENDEEVRKEVSREVVREPVTKVIRIGTKALEIEEPIDPEESEESIEPIEPIKPVDPEDLEEPVEPIEP